MDARAHGAEPTAGVAVRRVPERLPPPLLRDPHPGALRALLHGAYGLGWLFACALGAPWLAWRALTRPGFARMVGERCGLGLARAPRARRVLVHGVSVGEVKVAQPLVRGLEAAYPGLEVVLSVTTDTGLELARKLFPGHRVVRFPADPAFLVRRFLERVAPGFVVLIELEIWPNFLRECNRRGVPVAVVNGRITDRSHAQYHLFRKLLPQFDRISHFCVQADEYARRFVRLGVPPERVLVTGNIKADGLRAGSLAPDAELARLLGASGRPCVVAGSTHEPEELALVRAARAAAPDARLVLVPRHPRRAAQLVLALREQAGCEAQLLTRLRAGEAPAPARPAIVDTIGELEAVYALADLVVVGGSLVPHGGQNMLEPAAQGKAVVYGPHVHNFAQEAALLEQAGAAWRVADEGELARAIGALLADPERRARMGRAGEAAVERQKGAAALTLAALDRLGLGALARGEAPRGACPAGER